MHKFPKLWRDSASIITLAKNNTHNRPNACNYKMLLQKRSGKSGFLPNTIVFPGGVHSETDSSKCWYEHFKSFGISNEKFLKFQSKDMLVPPILQGDQSPLNRHVSLRITAIRETFEELGVLICRQQYHKTNNYAQYITDFDIKHWQKRVHDDPLEFLTLCQELKCFPDIWSLYLWCNWLTPIGYETTRFDTIFFLTAFETTPPVYAEESEVSKVLWQSPEDVIENYENKDCMLPPPQWYEISKLIHQKDVDVLLDFSAARSPLGCEQIYPILLYPKKGKGWLAIFPGDELYPECPDFEKQTVVRLENKTIEELQQSAKFTHRMELYDLYNINVKLKNFTPFKSQLSPLHGKIPVLN